MMKSISMIHKWLDEEKKSGCPEPDYAVLATSSKNGVPSSRVVHIREINEKGILFFSQLETRKVTELLENPSASMTIWLPIQQREIVLDGSTEKLASDENQHYWKSIPRDRQLRFIVNSLRAKNPHLSLGELNEKFSALSTEYQEKEIPMSPFYCGFCFIPETMYFYTMISNGFDEIYRSCFKT